MTKTKRLANIIIFSALLVSFSGKTFSQDAFSPIKTINPDAGKSSPSELTINLDEFKNVSNVINLSENDAFYHMTGASDRFVQCNIVASWGDFKSLINDAPDNDFIYVSLANKMAELGFFDLANLAKSKIKDKDISSVSIDAMERFYYPRRKLSLEDELFLAEIYSNILYNNQSSEATNELLQKDTILSNSDYANYLVALGSYKSDFHARAKKYINIALIQNPTNLNYQKLKAEILAGNNDPEEALKVIEELKKQNLHSYEYERKIKALEQFILYKISKDEKSKNYHLGYYFYLENDSPKAIRTLQGVFSQKGKVNNGLVYALMSEIYLSINEYEKASDTAKKACKIKWNLPQALITLGDLSYNNGNYKQALNYYKQACAADKKAYTPLVKEAQAYQKLSNIKKAKEIYTKILKVHSDCWEAYYNVALLDKEKEVTYLKKALAINPLFETAWVELARTEIDKGNYNIAQKYLANAFYIDENDFRYYYYQGQINNSTGNLNEAKYNFKKCLKLNSKFKEAQDALNIILNNENGIRQDRI